MIYELKTYPHLVKLIASIADEVVLLDNYNGKVFTMDRERFYNLAEKLNQ